MTLSQFFDYLSANPILTLAFFVFPPLVAMFVAYFGKGKGYEQPWRSVYSVLVYLVCIPGILALSLLTYLFLFERMSVWNINLLTQGVPILSMMATLWLIQRNVDLSYVPGFGRVSGLMGMIAGLIFIMWIADRMRLVMFSYMPASYVAVIFIGVLIVMQVGWRKAFRQ
ncbi:MAG: hypothetical protein AB8F78_08570 [Saprospiraceae bacterium]